MERIHRRTESSRHPNPSRRHGTSDEKEIHHLAGGTKLLTIQVDHLLVLSARAGLCDHGPQNARKNDETHHHLPLPHGPI